jgi:D-glycero-alpha-D-manno-heptose-7-phosphate kinase
MLRARAPIRFDFAGGWTDVPPMACELGGHVLAGAISLFATVKVERLQGTRVVVTSEDFGEQVEGADPEALVYDGRLDLLKAAVRRFLPQGGVKVSVRADVPPGSGTGSSAAVGVALIAALTAMVGQPLPADELAEAARLLETEELKNACGRQDHYTAAYGGVNLWHFGKQTVSGGALALAPEVLRELEQRLVLCYSRASRVSGTVVSRVIDRYQRRDESVVAALAKLGALAQQGAYYLLAGEIDRFGSLLGENWQAQRALDPSITTARVDELMAIATGAGALGGKALGAGGGGCLLFCCAAGHEAEVRRELAQHDALPLRWTFWERGIEVWRSLDR